MVAIRRRIALYIFCAVVAVAPLPFGSVDEMVIAFWAILPVVGLGIAQSVAARDAMARIWEPCRE
jgi:hypothetical protein